MSQPSESTPSRPASPVGALPDNLTSARQTYRFTWDPAARRPGPESVAGTTEGGRGADQFATQPRLGFLNTSSATTLAMSSIPSEWSSAKHGFHAISTVLNNPHKRQAPPKAHSSLPAVPPADLPRVRRKDFDSYLKAITPEWERYERSVKLGREGAAQLSDSPTTPRASLSTDDPKSSPAPTGSPSRSIPPLDSVPAVFFDKNFDLSNPHTFASVTEQDSGGIGDANDPSALADSHQLLEKLSHHADTVEQHLIREIALRSSSFFSALTNLTDLQTESEQCLARIASLRQSLKEVDEKVAKKGMEIVRLECKVRNIEKTKEGVKFVSGVVEMSGVAKSLVNAGQWGEALDVIEELDQMWKEKEETTEPSPQEKRNRRRSSVFSSKSSSLPATVEEESLEPPAIPTVHVTLSSLKAFASLPSHLRALTMEITTSLSSELVSVLRDDLVDCMNIQSDSPQANVKLSLQDRLRPALQGLVRTHSVKEATLSWREAAMAEMRNIMRKQFPTIEWHEEDGKGIELANHLRRLSHSEFIEVLQRVYTVLLKAIQGIQHQNKTIIEVLESIESHSNPLNIPAIQDELTDILSSSAELAHIQAANIIIPRAEQHSSLGLPEFLVLFNESWSFVVKCEVICRRMIVGLRGVVVSQATSFLQAFHQARLSRSAKLLEDEKWNPAEVSPCIQRFVDVILDSAVRDPAELMITSESTQVSLSASPPPTTNGTSAPNQAPTSPTQPTKRLNGSGNSPSKPLKIEDRAYFAVSATVDVLLLLLDYLKVIVNLPMLTTDTMSRIIEFLKSFNSRTCQVVLGAGAMRSAGLKNITAKHLALASQSLSIMSDLIPYVREAFRRHLSPKQAVMLIDFDKLKRDFQDHQNEIHDKLIAIMGDRLSAHIVTLQGIDWNVPKPGGGVNEYMEILTKETVTLHRVLSRYLSTQIVEYVMTQVFAAINHRLSEEYGKIELPNQAAKDRLLEDARYLHQKLSALKNVGTPSAMLETVIMEKSIPRKTLPPVPQRNSTLYSVSSSANQRLKGLLARSSTIDKALPIPSRSETPPMRSESPRPLLPSEILNGSRTSLITLDMSTTSLVSTATEAGFKQVDADQSQAQSIPQEPSSQPNIAPLPNPPTSQDDTNPSKAGVPNTNGHSQELVTSPRPSEKSLNHEVPPDISQGLLVSHLA
ncbi:hypothetical protein AX16_008826 [Volvariella volvacea WC 439]|nr:hypothetical protein AX16_008826 [Volvariella volvacea WC 439]